MDPQAQPKRSGCGPAVAITGMLLWLLLVPPLLRLALRGVGTGLVGDEPIARSGAVLLLLFLPYFGIAWVTRRPAGWSDVAATAAALATLAGSLAFDLLLRAVPLASQNGTAALRLGTLLLYLLAAAAWAPRLAGIGPAASPSLRAGRPRLWSVLALDRFRPAPFLLGLTVAALVSLPWPYTGALGDRLTSAGLAFQSLAELLPVLLLVYGVVFFLLNSTFTRPWLAALVTMIAYLLLHGASGFLTPGGGRYMQDAATLLPPVLLLAELRAREGGIYPLLPAAWAFRAMPLLFIDPRDALAGGMAEMQHLLSYLFAIAAGIGLGLALWGGRRIFLWIERRHGSRLLPGWIGVATASLAALILLSAWTGLYTYGKPGFADDGFLIVLEEQADLSAASTIADRTARLQTVYDRLTETAERTQAPLRAELEALGVPYQPYYIVNMIRVDGHHWLMHRFEGRPGVAQVLLNPNVRDYPHRLPLLPPNEDAPPPQVEPNLAAIHADQAWAMGVTGTGIVVAGQDTGYDWTHPALRPHYRGWDGETAHHDYNWHDAWDDSAEPFDSDYHGTHTMGTILGDDGAHNQVGVAPGARWFGCRNMRRGLGNPGAYAECMEFFLAPYPHGGDPFHDGDVTQAPHLVNNSWGCPTIEGCQPDTLKVAVEALRAAGIMMVVSAGNDGPACTTATTPPANYEAVFSVGATDNQGHIVGFSSRGPVEGRIKPDVAAPGSSVRSCVPGGHYARADGTSMAGPHVAGLVALLWSAAPSLIGQIDATEALICRTAVAMPVDNRCTAADEVPAGPAGSLTGPVCACGDVAGVPNNVYGCGFIDAGAAVKAALGK